jgi:imidazolonepropionase-like amidohydrolase
MRKTLISFLLSLGFLGFAVSSAANEGTIAFVGATIIDGTSAPPLENGVLVITDGRIRTVGSEADVSLPQGTQVVDVSGKYIMPGLINAHGHVGATIGLDGNGGYSRANLLRQLGLYARYGVTAINSLGGDQVEGFELRNEQFNNGLVRARIYVAGSVVVGDSEQAIRAEVNRNADMGADFIKVRIDDNLGASEKISRPFFEALVDQAHKRRLPVAVHLYYLEDAKFMLRTGADVIAHSVRDLPIDRDFINMMNVSDTCYIPTLTREVSTYIYESVPDFFQDPYFTKEVDSAIIEELSTPERMSSVAGSRAAQIYKAQLPVAMDNLGVLHDEGIRVAMGTDTGPPARFQGYFEHMEMHMMVDAGMSPLEAIRASTGVAADCIGMGDIGSLEPGKWGDFSILAENPAVDIRNSHSIESVYIAGNLVPIE